jgi:hypothetical protein
VRRSSSRTARVTRSTLRSAEYSAGGSIDGPARVFAAAKSTLAELSPAQASAPKAFSALPARSTTMVCRSGRAVSNVMSCWPVCDARIIATRFPSGDTAAL